MAAVGIASMGASAGIAGGVVDVAGRIAICASPGDEDCINVRDAVGVAVSTAVMASFNVHGDDSGRCNTAMAARPGA